MKALYDTHLFTIHIQSFEMNKIRWENACHFRCFMIRHCNVSVCPLVVNVCVYCCISMDIFKRVRIGSKNKQIKQANQNIF